MRKRGRRGRGEEEERKERKEGSMGSRHGVPVCMIGHRVPVHSWTWSASLCSWHIFFSPLSPFAPFVFLTVWHAFAPIANLPAPSQASSSATYEVSRCAQACAVEHVHPLCYGSQGAVLPAVLGIDTAAQPRGLNSATHGYITSGRTPFYDKETRGGVQGGWAPPHKAQYLLTSLPP
jgi:hypothetical protein